MIRITSSVLGRVVKAVGSRSIGVNTSWVRTPQHVCARLAELVKAVGLRSTGCQNLVGSNPTACIFFAVATFDGPPTWKTHTCPSHTSETLCERRYSGSGLKFDLNACHIPNSHARFFKYTAPNS